MNIQFYLKTNKNSSNLEQPIFCYFRQNGRFKSLYIGQRILPKFWDSKKKIAKRGYAHEALLNKFIQSYKNRAMKIILEEQANDPEVTFEQIAAVLERKLKNKSQPDFFEIYDQYYEYLITRISKGSIGKYRSLKITLSGFHAKTGMVQFNFLASSNMTVWFDKFVDYLANEANHQNNTIRKDLQFLRTFLRWASDRGYVENFDIHKMSRVQLPAEASKSFISLSTDEIEQIKNVELPEVLDKVRDTFLFQLYTGQRFSDIEQFHIDQVDKVALLWILRQKKGGAKKGNVSVPLIKPALELLQKYNFKLPVTTNQQANRHLKEVARLAGIDSACQSEKIFSNGEIVITKHPKYELVCTHTARRTFATLTIYAGVSSSVIKSYTGHSTDKMLQRYFQEDGAKSKTIIENVFSQ